MRCGLVVGAILLGALAAWCIAANWITLVVQLRGRHVSFVPLIGGVLGAAALASAPGRVSDWWWVAFFADFGSLPYAVFVAFFFAKRARDMKRTRP